MMNRMLILVASVLLLQPMAGADEETVNAPVVRSSECGRFYARSMPDEGHGQKGKTLVYSVLPDGDQKICEYDWYATEIRLHWSGLVRFGPWQRGHATQDDHLAIGFYQNGKTIREYSTKEMEKLSSGLEQSVSHYQVFGKRIGFRWLDRNRIAYEVEGVSGKLFTFDLGTGGIVEQAAKRAE